MVFKIGGTLGAIGNSIKKGLSDFGESAKEAVGIKARELPDEAKLQVDPGRAAALSQYGQGVTSRYGQTQQPGQYTSPRYTPTKINNAPMGTSRLNETNVNYTPQQRQLPNTGYSAQKLAGYSQQVQGPQTQQVSNQPLAQQRTEDYRRIGLQDEQAQRADALDRPWGNEGSQNLNLTREGGNVIKLSQPGQQANNGFYKGNVDKAVMRASDQMGAPLTEGYDPNMRNVAASLATARMGQKKQQALAAMKEQQMAAGNYGSSIGQKQLADLQAEYDQKEQDALNTIEMQQMQAARDDRYRNEDVTAGRINQVANISNAGQNMNIQDVGFGREGINMNNATTLQENQYNLGLRNTDRNSATQEAQFGREGRNLDYNAQQQRVQFEREGRQINNQNRMQEAQFGREGRNIDYGSEAANSEFGRAGTQYNNDLAFRMAQYNAGENQRQFGNQMNAQQFGREGEQMGYQNQIGADQQNFGNMMTAEEFNRQGRQITNADDIARMNEEQRRAELDAARQDYGNQFNMGNDRADYNTNYGRYRDTVGDMANYANGQAYTPESLAANQNYAAQEAQRQATQGAFVGAATSIGSAMTGIPRMRSLGIPGVNYGMGSGQGESGSRYTNGSLPSPTLPPGGVGPTNRANMRLGSRRTGR